MDWLEVSIGAGMILLFGLFLFSRANAHKKPRNESGSATWPDGGLQSDADRHNGFGGDTGGDGD